MSTVIFERISWIFNALTDTVSKLKISGLLQQIYDDYKRVLFDSRGFFKRNTILNLSEDCLVEIFKKLEHKDLVNCSKVCKQWQNVIECHHELWYSVKFALKCSASNIPAFHASNFDQLQLKTIIQHKQNRSVAKFLSNNHVHVRSLAIDFSELEQLGFNVLAFVLSSGCCETLRRASLKWSENWSYGDSPEFCQSHKFFLALLALLQEFVGRDFISLSSYFHWTADSVRIISHFRQIHHLELHSVPRVHCIQKWYIDKLLEELVNLKKLKLTVTCIPKLAQQYSFSSLSLETLDISNCVNFFIASAEMPNLKYFIAEDVQCHRMGINMHKFCLLDVLETGCPKLQRINKYPIARNDNRWTLNNKQCKMCFCARHGKY